MKLTIAWVGKTKNTIFQSLTEEYLKRLRQYAEAEGVCLKDGEVWFEDEREVSH